jgi:hypothetical protein
LGPCPERGNRLERLDCRAGENGGVNVATRFNDRTLTIDDDERANVTGFNQTVSVEGCELDAPLHRER